MIPKTFGEEVKLRRKELGLTAEELAKRAGIVRTYVSRIERHNFLPSPKVFGKLMKVLGDKRSPSNFKLSIAYLGRKYPWMDTFPTSFTKAGKDFEGFRLLRKNAPPFIKKKAVEGKELTKKDMKRWNP